MGFRRDRPTYRLKFHDPELAGLVITVHSTSMAELIGLAEGAALLDQNDSTTLLKGSVETFRPFVNALVEWNLEDADGVPTPMTLEGFMSHDMNLVLQVMKAYQDALTAVPRPLQKPSGNGRQFPEVSMPMEIQSPNPMNSPLFDSYSA